MFQSLCIRVELNAYSALSVRRACVGGYVVSFVTVSGAPTLSRLLEAGPAQFPSQLSSLTTADSTPSASTSAVDTASSLSTGLS